MSRFGGANLSSKVAVGGWPHAPVKDAPTPSFSPTGSMVDPVQLRPKGEVQADREALEHIARAVQGRVLRGPGSLSPAGALGLETLSLSRASIEALLEAMPAAPMPSASAPSKSSPWPAGSRPSFQAAWRG